MANGWHAAKGPRNPYACVHPWTKTATSTTRKPCAASTPSTSPPTSKSPSTGKPPIAAGTGKTHVIQDPDQTLRLPRSHLDSLQIVYADAICTTMVGNSMAERIEDGSVLAIDRGLTQIVDGQIYAIEHDGMLRIKYLHRLPGNGLRLRSHNQAQYPDEVFSAAQIDEQKIWILGWVFWWSTLNKKRPPIPFLGRS